MNVSGINKNQLKDNDQKIPLGIKIFGIIGLFGLFYWSYKIIIDNNYSWEVWIQITGSIVFIADYLYYLLNGKRP